MTDLTALIARHKNCRPNAAENPAWANCEHDMGVLIAAIEQLQAELDVATMALKLKPRPYADADLLIEERDAARGIAHGLHEGLELMSVERDALRAELDLRNKGDPVKRLHNLCDALMEQANESPFTKEQWDQLDAENVSLRAELEACKEDISELRSLDNEAQHGADALRAELAAVKQDAERYRWLKTHGEVWGGVPEIGPPGEFMWRWRWTLTRAQYDQNRVDSLTTAIDVARGQGKGDNAGLVGLECDVSHANWGLTEDTAFLDEEEKDDGN